MMLADRRRLRRTVNDALWLSILDVPEALMARRFAVPGELTIEVAGSFADGVDGTYRLAGDRDGAECRAADGAADLTLSAAELGALYLGGSRLRPMVTWGTARGSDDAIRLADAMFGWDEAPWCPEIF